jgi:hypothetical protein
LAAGLDVVDQATGRSIKTGGLGAIGASEDLRVKETSGSVVISDIEVDMTSDRDWTGVTADSDTGQKKAVVANLTSAPGAAATHTLYIPREADDPYALICPDAATLVQVTTACSNVEMKVEEDADTEIVTINSQSYWKVTGLTGTGGLSGSGFSGAQAWVVPQTVSTASEMTILFRANTTLDDEDKVLIGLPDDFTVKTGALTTTTDYLIYYDAINPPTTNRTSGSSATGSNTPGSKEVRITLNGTNAIQANDYVQVVLTTTTITSNPATRGFYQVTIKTLDSSNSDSTVDSGAALVSVGNAEDVTVQAEVNPTLSFAIRNSADSAETNSCALGILSTSAVATCSYRLKVATNAFSGYAVSIIADGALRDGTKDIDAIGEGTTVAAGTEGYGIALSAGAASEAGVTITEAGDFNDDDTPLPLVSTSLYSSDGPNTPTTPDTTNTGLVTHRAAIDAATSAGSYSQVVTYLVTAEF